MMENFRRPYFSKSPVEFWSKDRWHISLNTWFRDYMYIPMGGSRVSKPRYYFNQMAVFLVSGLWHGANTGTCGTGSDPHLARPIYVHPP